MELADVIVINKADGSSLNSANVSASYHEVGRGERKSWDRRLKERGVRMGEREREEERMS